METRKRHNTGAGREGLVPRKKDKEEHESVRSSNRHWRSLADGLQQEAGIHTPQGNDRAVERPSSIYRRAGEARKHDWDKKSRGLRLRRPCCSCRTEVPVGLVCRICHHESCPECLHARVRLRMLIRHTGPYTRTGYQNRFDLNGGVWYFVIAEGEASCYFQVLQKEAYPTAAAGSEDTPFLAGACRISRSCNHTIHGTQCVSH